VIEGTHDSSAALAPAEIEAVHRISTDPGRIGNSWYRRLLTEGLTDTRYVELVAVVAVVTAIDSFHYAAGLEFWDLPAPQNGLPTCRRPCGAKLGVAWMPILAPEDRTNDDPDLYREHPGPRQRYGANIHRALSLVPAAMIDWWDLFETMYQTSHEMRDFSREPRAVTHPQMELLAARVAALNRCEY
jgi:hypothetical protein